MADIDALKAALRSDGKSSAGSGARTDAATRRQLRAQRTFAQAISPMRIFTQVLLVPVVTLALTVSIYTRISPYERTDALRHLAALAGCDTAASMGLAPAFRGGLGYHARNDPDNDGVACAPTGWEALAAAPAVAPARAVQPQTATGAKFLTP